MKKSKHSAAYIRRTIDVAWLALVLAAKRYSEHTDAFEAECETERGHRAMGARWTKGQASYRLPAHYAAKLMVLQHTYEAMVPPTSWVDATMTSHRVALCYALRERLVTDGIFGAAFPDEAFMAIDYAEDIAA